MSWVNLSDPVFLVGCAVLIAALAWYVSAGNALRRRQTRVEMSRAGHDLALTGEYSSWQDKRDERKTRGSVDTQKELAEHESDLRMRERSHEMDLMVSAAHEANLATTREAQALEGEIRALIKELAGLEAEVPPKPREAKWSKELLKIKQDNYRERFARR